MYKINCVYKERINVYTSQGLMVHTSRRLMEHTSKGINKEKNWDGDIFATWNMTLKYTYPLVPKGILVDRHKTGGWKDNLNV